MSLESTHPRLPGRELIFGSSAGMLAVREVVNKAIHDDLPLLIEGESGSGKEMISRFVHSHSVRKGATFLKLNCAASTALVMESVLYGNGGAPSSVHTRSEDSPGLISGGTLFLDEIGELDQNLQQKLAETMASGHYRSAEGRHFERVNARLMSSSTTGPQSEMESHGLAGSGLKSLAHHHLRLVPLRERKEDIPSLCEYLLAKFAREFGRSVPQLSSDVLEAFHLWEWPGNIRELENWIARIVIFGAEEAIGLQFKSQNHSLITWDDRALGRQQLTKHSGSRQRVRRHR